MGGTVGTVTLFGVERWTVLLDVGVMLGRNEVLLLNQASACIVVYVSVEGTHLVDIAPRRLKMLKRIRGFGLLRRHLTIVLRHDESGLVTR